MIAENVASTTALSVGVSLRAAWIEMPSRSQARLKVSETNTFPWSMATCSGTMTGRAAASRIRASMLTSRSNGSREADIRKAFAHPGRIGSGTRHLGQQGRVDGLGADRAQYRGADGAGGDVDGDGEVGAVLDAVGGQDHDVDRGGVDLDLLTGPRGGRRGERPGGSVGGLAPGDRRAERVLPDHHPVHHLPLDLQSSKVRGARAEIVLQLHGELIGTERARV
ncbi:hypothetical protein [Amycolatopsis sp. NPDC051061]|uniref:hypothetical protein n=1 Tax=Amycolatopsis sp. NPDC051061 TaxID=3155042 RepID=UPI003428B8B5